MSDLEQMSMSVRALEMYAFVNSRLDISAFDKDMFNTSYRAWVEGRGYGNQQGFSQMEQIARVHGYQW